MKKTSVLVLFLAFLITSCNQSNKKKFVVGVSQCSDDSWRRLMNEEILREASFYEDLEVQILSADDSNQKQIRDIENFINQHVDLLIISPNSAIPLTSVVEKAYKKGIPVVLVDRKINSNNYNSFIGADNYQIGKEVAAYINNLLNGNGNILEIRGLSGSSSDYERHSGLISNLSQYPDIHLVSQIYGNWSRTIAKQKMIGVLKENIDIDLVFAQNDEMGAGVYDALKDMGRLGKRPYIIGIDALPGNDGGIQHVLNGSLDATFFYPTGGEKVIQTAVNILKKKPYDEINMLYTAVVDETNARIIKLQTDQIQYHQNRINNLNTEMNKNLAVYSTQRTILILSLVTILIFIVFVLLLFRSFRNKNRINQKLEETNQKLEETNYEINKQKEEISEQRDQLVTLSKNLEEATQAKLTFFTNISHEFRTPLSLLLGPLQTITKSGKFSSDLERLLQIMNKNVLVLMKLIDQIIDFRKYENGKMKMFYTLGDLKQFINEKCDSFVEIARKKRIHFNFSTSADDFTLWFDTDKMEKISNNLISNALKFTPENGKINVHLAKIVIDGEDYAKLTVKDSGIGISNEHIHKIFDRFYRADEQMSSGSGIGLALTKVLVEQHSGIIEVTSTPGQGSVFEISVPFKQKNILIDDQYPVLDSKSFNQNETALLIDSEEDENEIDDEFEIDDPKKVNLLPSLLIIEDNSDVRAYIKMLFKDLYRVSEASNGHNGYLMAVKNIPDIIISDVMMDGIDGYELCKNIKENITTSHIPVILLTALSMDEQRAKGFESGADAYISKPFNEDILMIRVKTILENKEKMKIHFQENLTFGDKKEKVNEIDKSFMDKFREYIEENISETDLNVDEIGRSLGLSRVQLYRKVKSLTNYAPNELVRIIRLKESKRLLLNPDKKIAEIAYEIGFSSPAYFTKCFREYFNESPSDFQKGVL